MKFFLAFIFIAKLISGEHSSSQTESIIDLYNRISEKGSLNDGLDLNDYAQEKLKTINTIRLIPLESEVLNGTNLRFRVNFNKIPVNEEIKLIEFRLTFRRKNLFLFVKKSHRRFQRIRPLLISTARSQYHSYDLTDHLFHNASSQIIIIRRQTRLLQASLVIYSRAPGAFLLPTPRKRTKRSIDTTGPCSRRDFFVDFSQLSFGQWVVEPKKFNAGICQGDCPNPLSRSYYPTNHAMLLSLLHERGNSIHQPSCVPVRLRPLDLLYYDRRELIIKRHQGMQVEECGCR